MKRERRCREIVLNACLNGKLSYLKKAYENGDVDSKMLSDVIENGKTPLFFAASAGNLDVVKFFAEKIDMSTAGRCCDLTRQKFRKRSYSWIV